MLKYKKIFFVSFFLTASVLIYILSAYLWALNSAEFAVLQYDRINKLENLELSKEQISIVLKIEDPSFWDNCGIDILTPGQGKTTITQSVVPILLYKAQFQDWRSVPQKVYRKVWSVAKKVDLGRDVMALALYQKVSKEKILKIFVEQAYMGSINGELIFGLSNAANIYFNKSLNNLSSHEFAGLVAILKSPDYFNPIKNPDAFRDRALKVSKLLSRSCSPKGLFDTEYSSCI